MNFVSRETIILVAVFVSLAASYYLYNEIKRNHVEICTIKDYVSRKLARSPTNEVKKQPEKQPIDEIEKQPVDDIEEENED